MVSKGIGVLYHFLCCLITIRNSSNARCVLKLARKTTRSACCHADRNFKERNSPTPFAKDGVVIKHFLAILAAMACRAAAETFSAVNADSVVFARVCGARIVFGGAVFAKVSSGAGTSVVVAPVEDKFRRGLLRLV